MTSISRSCLSIAAILTYIGTSSLAAGASVVSLIETSQVPVTLRSVAGANEKPVWSGGALVGIAWQRTSAPLVYEFDRDGRRLPDVSIRVPDVEHLLIRQIARSNDGVIALAASATGSSAERTVRCLVIISPDRSQQLVLRTAPFNVQAITFASDGSLWAAGADVDANGVRFDGHAMIRRFDTSGRLLGSYTLRTEFPDLNPQVHPSTMSQLIASENRVGWYSPEGRVYIEYDLEGRELLRAPAVPNTHILGAGPLRKRITGIALTTASDVVLGLSGEQVRNEVVTLDRQTLSWVPMLDRTTGGTIWIAGADGANVVAVAQDGLRFLRALKD